MQIYANVTKYSGLDLLKERILKTQYEWRNIESLCIFMPYPNIEKKIVILNYLQ